MHYPSPATGSAHTKTRDAGEHADDLVVSFDKPDGSPAVTIVEEWDTFRSVGETVGIRYRLDSSGQVDYARLTEQPVGSFFFAVACIALVVALGVFYWAWWRMPPDRAPRM